jgi:hypothetical protein
MSTIALVLIVAVVTAIITWYLATKPNKGTQIEIEDILQHGEQFNVVGSGTSGPWHYLVVMLPRGLRDDLRFVNATYLVGAKGAVPGRYQYQQSIRADGNLEESITIIKEP